MKKLILLLKFLRTGLTIRNLFISILGVTVFLFIIFAIQFFMAGSLDSIRWDNDLIFPIILGAAVSLGFFEKPTITWEEYWKKNS
jgi:hypothetical protein